jgi:hypothetical protein
VVDDISSFANQHLERLPADIHACRTPKAIRLDADRSHRHPESLTTLQVHDFSISSVLSMYAMCLCSVNGDASGATDSFHLTCTYRLFYCQRCNLGHTSSPQHYSFSSRHFEMPQELHAPISTQHQQYGHSTLAPIVIAVSDS